MTKPYTPGLRLPPFGTSRVIASLLLLAFAEWGCSSEGEGSSASGGYGAAGAPASGGMTGGGGSVAIGGSSLGGLPGAGGSAAGGVPSGGRVGSGGSAVGGASSGGWTGTGGLGAGGLGAGGLGAGGAAGQGAGGQGLGTGGTAGQGAGGAQAGEGGSGGSAAGAAGDGGGSAVGFQPCPQTGPCKILPLGDSITFGLGFDGGYRVELFRLAQSDGHDVTFTGTQQPNGPGTVAGVPFPRNHAGISGETIEQIAARIPNPDLTEVPHIVLLHAGTNDMWAGANGADGRLGNLIDELITEAPDALIVVSNIIPFPMSAASVSSYNATIPGIVEERADAGAHVLFVDQFEGFPESELGDGVHPNEAGYARMAAKWYDAISGYLR